MQTRNKTCGGDFGNNIIKCLPQPSQEFIDKYIQQYNKGNVITDVLVEYEIGKCNCRTGGVFDGCVNEFNTCNVTKLKVNPKDNTITIRKVKDTVKVGEELCSIMQQYHEYCTWSGYITPQKWVEENL